MSLLLGQTTPHESNQKSQAAETSLAHENNQSLKRFVTKFLLSSDQGESNLERNRIGANRNQALNKWTIKMQSTTLKRDTTWTCPILNRTGLDVDYEMLMWV